MFTLTGSHLFHWQAKQNVCFCLSTFSTFPAFSRPVSAGVARSLPLSAIWVSHEAGSLPPSVFTLSTQLLSCALLSLPMEEMRTCQREHLAAETTADKAAGCTRKMWCLGTRLAKAKLAGEVVRKSYLCPHVACGYRVKLQHQGYTARRTTTIS